MAAPLTGLVILGGVTARAERCAMFEGVYLAGIAHPIQSIAPSTWLVPCHPQHITHACQYSEPIQRLIAARGQCTVNAPRESFRSATSFSRIGQICGLAACRTSDCSTTETHISAAFSHSTLLGRTRLQQCINRQLAKAPFCECGTCVLTSMCGCGG